MQSKLAESVLSGTKKLVKEVESKAAELMLKDQDLKYPDTAYELPVVYSLSNFKVKKTMDLKPLLEYVKGRVNRGQDTPAILENGITSLYAIEILAALKYAEEENPYKTPYIGFIPDEIIRRLGLPLVDGTINGIALVAGKAKGKEEAVKIVRELQEKSMLTLLAGEIVEQLQAEKINLGLDYKLIPLGKEATSIAHAVNIAVRVGLIFGGLSRGQEKEMREYLKNKVKVLVIALGKLDDITLAVGAGAIACGFPVVSDQKEIPEIPGLLLSQTDYGRIVSTALEAKSIKVKVVKIPIPIAYGLAFEGERVRKNDAYVEVGGGRSAAFELLRARPFDEVEDHRIALVGRDLDEVPEGSVIPMAILVDVAGRKMIKDFEPVLERRIHDYVNYGEGLWHVAQRDLVWIRVSRDAFRKGFRLKHLGEILYSKIHTDFSQIVDRVQVSIVTDEQKVKELIAEARKVYAERDERIKGLTDEQVDMFYSCTLCQSFAPNHVCIVTPERSGLCGGINWLDARAGFELNPSGPNQPIRKEKPVDEYKGQWNSVNEFLRRASHGALGRFNMYCLMESNCTSCGCFECVVLVLPEANGVMIVNREHSGDTPAGMKFSTLAGSVGGGVQTPGFMGISKKYITSRKFIQGDGGLKRVVWMPSSLKEAIKEDLKKKCVELGLPDFADKIADENNAKTLDELVEHLNRMKHPALQMKPII